MTRLQHIYLCIARIPGSAGEIKLCKSLKVITVQTQYNHSPSIIIPPSTIQTVPMTLPRSQSHVNRGINVGSHNEGYSQILSPLPTQIKYSELCPQTIKNFPSAG